MKNTLPVTEIKVGLDFGAGVQAVGRLAMFERKIYFEFNSAFIRDGVEISVFYLPLKSGVVSFDYDLFDGLFGVFNDSLPDGWGRLLVDRFARSQGILPSGITPLQRLAQVGSHGMGALVYQPDHSPHVAGHDVGNTLGLDRLAEQAQQVLDGKAVEYVYALMAKEAGITMPDVHLFAAAHGAGYFSAKRFDRDGKKRFHMHTVCGLMYSDFRAPSLDYEHLLALTIQLTRDIREMEKMYRLAVFNVLAHNRDDHAKNFSFLMNSEAQWTLSPAYDLTFSSGPRGEQSTTVMGQGRTPGVEHLMMLGEAAKMAKPRVCEIIEQTQAALSLWPKLALQHGVSSTNRKLIAGLIMQT